MVYMYCIAVVVSTAYMRNLALTLGILVTAKEPHLLKSFTHKFAGKKLELVKALYHCKPAMALPPAERKAIINWISSK